MRLRWLLAAPALVVARAVRVRLSVGPRHRYWIVRSTPRTPAIPALRSDRPTRGEFVLIALGDSLTQGIGSSRPSTSWLGLFVAELASTSGREVRVVNRARYGARIADVLATQLPLGSAADLVTVCIGSNDAGRTPPTLFRAELEELCRQLPAGSIVGDVPEFQWGPRISAAAELSQIVREVVATFPSLVLARVEDHTIGTRILTELAGDFFHPNDSGYRRIADAFIAASSGRRRVSVLHP